jgi:cell division septation protein DedD
MNAPLDSTESPHVIERRNCGRQKVLFSSVAISENNCGRILNISPNGMALQTDTELVGEFQDFRFKFSPLFVWVEAKARVVWKNSSKGVVGTEFIGLADEVQKQIQTWIGSKSDLNDESKSNTRVAGTVGNKQSGVASIETTETVTNREDREDREDPKSQKTPGTPKSRSLFPLESVNLPPANQSQPSTITIVQQVETKDFGGRADQAGGIGKRPKTVGLALVIIILTLLAVFVRRDHQQTKAIAGASHPSSPPIEATVATPNSPATSSNGIASAVSPPIPAAPSSVRKPALHGPTFVLQVAAMVKEQNANALASSLREMNFPAFVMKFSNQHYHHVLVGPYDSAKAANDTQNALEKRGFKPIRREWKVPTP